MKRFIYIFILPVLLFGNSIDDLKSELIEQIVDGLIPRKQAIVYIKDEKYKNISLVKNIKKLSTWCSSANFILTDDVNKLSENCKNRKVIIFVTNYKEYKNNNFVAGALFWQKGRPNLIFRKQRLDELSIIIPKSFEKYAE